MQTEFLILNLSESILALTWCHHASLCERCSQCESFGHLLMKHSHMNELCLFVCLFLHLSKVTDPDTRMRIQVQAHAHGRTHGVLDLKSTVKFFLMFFGGIQCAWYWKNPKLAGHGFQQWASILLAFPRCRNANGGRTADSKRSICEVCSRQADLVGTYQRL